MVKVDDRKEVKVKAGKRRRVSQKLKIETIGFELWNRPGLSYERGKRGRRHAGGGSARPYAEVTRLTGPRLIRWLSTSAIPFSLGVCHTNNSDRSRGWLASNYGGFGGSEVRM